MPRILLFGAGSIGAVYTHVLSKAGADVTAVCRSNYEAVKANGFIINSKLWGRGLSVKPSVISSPAEAEGIWDYIVVCSKAFPGSSPSTAELIKPAVSPKTTIVLIQNGVGIESEYASAFPSSTLFSCVVLLPVTQVSPGIIEMGTLERLEIGTYPALTAEEPGKRVPEQDADAFAALIRAGGATAETFEDIQPRRWSKLVINASWNPICALCRRSDVEFMDSSPDATSLVYSVMLEVVAVAQALGYAEITPELARKQLQRALDRRPDRGIEPSMLGDVRGGRAMEVEAIVGNPIKFAREKGVKTPLLEMLYALAKALDEGIHKERLRAGSADRRR